jgi:hypothetical protein
VSLRADIHAAFDEVAPSTFGMPERVVQTVVRELPNRRRSERWFIRLRAPLSIVAVLLLLAVVVGTLVSGRVWHDWTTFTNRPVPAVPIDKAELALLEARQVNLPVLKPGEDCPAGPYGSYWGFGDGPVSFVYVLRAKTTAWGTYVNAAASTDYRLTGLVLGRARDLLSGAPVVFVGPNAAGPIVGNDTVDSGKVQQRTEVVLDANHRPPATQDSGRLVVWGLQLGFANDAKGSSGCVGFQFDGASFSETFVTP